MRQSDETRPSTSQDFRLAGQWNKGPKTEDRTTAVLLCIFSFFIDAT